MNEQAFMADQLTPELSPEDVGRVAFLARLELSDGEKQRLTGDLNNILLQFARLQELDTTGVEPTSHSLPLVNVLRADAVRPSLPREEVLRNAPQARDGSFIVPQIMED